MTVGTVVIIGAGHAGFQLAASLRQHGFSDRIALVNDEGHLPYQRPPLSKAYLKGTGGPDSLMFRPEKFYHDQKIDLISDRAVSIDRAARKVLLASGAWLDYGHLVLATGARNRLLDIPNANLDGVRYLRTLDESQSLRDYIAPGQRVVVIGARIHRPGIRRDRPRQGPRSRCRRTRHAGDGARGDRRNLGVFPVTAYRRGHSHSNTPEISSAFLSANSGLVLYLIKVRFIIASMAGFAMRNHRVSADRRLATTEGFGREEIIRPFRADADVPDDAVLISPDWQGLHYIWGLGSNFRRITYQPNVSSLKSKAASHDRSEGPIRTTPSRRHRRRRLRRAGGDATGLRARRSASR